MKAVCRMLCLAILSGPLVGCSDPAASDTTATATPDNPQAGLDALKKIGGPVDPMKTKTGAKTR